MLDSFDILCPEVDTIGPLPGLPSIHCKLAEPSWCTASALLLLCFQSFRPFAVFPDVFILPEWECESARECEIVQHNLKFCRSPFGSIPKAKRLFEQERNGTPSVTSCDSMHFYTPRSPSLFASKVLIRRGIFFCLFLFVCFLFLAGFWLLVSSFWLLAFGFWLLALAPGFWLLTSGIWLLASSGFWLRASGFCGFWLGCNSAWILFIVCMDLLYMLYM